MAVRMRHGGKRHPTRTASGPGARRGRKSAAGRPVIQIPDRILIPLPFRFASAHPLNQPHQPEQPESISINEGQEPAADSHQSRVTKIDSEEQDTEASPVRYDWDHTEQGSRCSVLYLLGRR